MEDAVVNGVRIRAAARIVGTDQVRPYINNPREHTDAGVGKIASSIKHFGWHSPIVVDKDMEIIVGHGRYLAAQRLGLKQVPVVVCEDLTPAQVRAARIADNRVAEESGWDAELLEIELHELKLEEFDLALTGLDMEELADVRGNTHGEGGTADVKAIGALQREFGAPPFSVLDARQGYWQERKRAWGTLGLRSEVGREHMEATVVQTEWMQRGSDTGGSIFDPVLCELTYRWFAPPGGKVLDPFAGGSVRGVVAAALGHPYVGIDLREEQVVANREQWDAISVSGGLGAKGDTVPIKISAKSAREKWNGCDVDFITSTCHGRCCTTTQGEQYLPILPHEQPVIEEHGGIVVDNMLQPVDGRCAFQQEGGLCRLHVEGQKPLACTLSPFTLNDNDTLVIKNRNRRMACYKAAPQVEGYRAYKQSLVNMFGEAEADRIEAHLDAGGGDLVANMPVGRYKWVRWIIECQRARGGVALPTTNAKRGTPVWHTGDGADCRQLAPGEYDLVFTCPPYGDLEVYSDDPRDLSTMEWDEFLEAYRAVMGQAVSMLKDNRFAVVVVGDIRDQRGLYRNFVGETVKAMHDAGLHLYNEAILVTPAGSLPLRAGRHFRTMRKLGKAHQNVLVFYKGDRPEAIKGVYPDNIIVADIAGEAQEGGTGTCQQDDPQN